MYEAEVKNINNLAHQTLYVLRSNNSEEDKSSPIFRLVDSIINLGLSLRASDIHIMPLSNETRLRYRIDGALFTPKIRLPASIQEQIISRIKVISHIKSVAVGVALDGHISYEYKGRAVDIRVAIVPVKFGESVALRIMNAEHNLKKIDELGLSADIEKALRQTAHQPYGMLIACGPMNSGKTTTLYAILQEINTPERNIMTIEDPVEGAIEGINQIAVNEEANLDFAGGLRAILRMDANAIMVGEIRDEETAKIAVRAALTGHLLLTTLHANDSISALFRLKEMGVPNYLTAATLSGIISQRLVRKICPHCREEYEITEDSGEYLFHKGKVNIGEVFFRGRGCEYCHGSGFYGRGPIHEFLQVSEELRSEILRLERMDKAYKTAKNTGFKTMQEDGIEKARRGITTLSEIGRVLYVE